MDITTRLTGNEVVIIDGAMGTELQRREVPLDFEIWSASALLTHPEVIRDIHVDYLRAGSTSSIPSRTNRNAVFVNS